MCGGRGTRLDTETEKPLYEIDGRPMIDRVHDALVASRVAAIHAVGAPDTPQTREYCERSLLESGGSFIEATGTGYVADLQYALERVDSPVVTVASDLPLLAGDAVDAVLDEFSGPSLGVHVPAALKRQLGTSLDRTRPVDGRELAPTGVNVVAEGDPEETTVTYDARLAVNVNRLSDASIAEALL
jgi:adenosylcobinamide-phosphate guanylyltransferase